MNYKEFVKRHSNEFVHSYIYDGEKKVGVVALTKKPEWTMGWSVCSEKDNFCKAKGKMIAYNRALAENKNHINHIPDKYINQIYNKTGQLATVVMKLLEKE